MGMKYYLESWPVKLDAQAVVGLSSLRLVISLQQPA